MSEERMVELVQGALSGDARRRRRVRAPRQDAGRRHRLKVKVHQRVNVRVLELIDDASGSTIELEGKRLPVTHTTDVIEALRR
jgi:hypothetical protein